MITNFAEFPICIVRGLCTAGTEDNSPIAPPVVTMAVEKPKTTDKAAIPTSDEGVISGAGCLITPLLLSSHSSCSARQSTRPVSHRHAQAVNLHSMINPNRQKQFPHARPKIAL